MEARPIEAVVFDMDGVLVDSEPIWRAVEQEVFAGVGIDITEDDLLETMGVRVADVVERWHRRHPWDEPSRQEIAETIVERVADAIEQGGALNESAVRAVDYVHGLGLRLALASSSPMRLIRAVLSIGGLADRFEVVLTAEDEEEGKPDPAVYRLGRPGAGGARGALSRGGGFAQRCPIGEGRRDGVRRDPRLRRDRRLRRSGSGARLHRGVRRSSLGGHGDGPGAGSVGPMNAS